MVGGSPPLSSQNEASKTAFQTYRLLPEDVKASYSATVSVLRSKLKSVDIATVSVVRSKLKPVDIATVSRGGSRIHGRGGA